MQFPKVTPELFRQWKTWEKNCLKDFPEYALCATCNGSMDCDICVYHNPSMHGIFACDLYEKNEKESDISKLNFMEHNRVTKHLSRNLELI